MIAEDDPDDSEAGLNDKSGVKMFIEGLGQERGGALAAVSTATTTKEDATDPRDPLEEIRRKNAEFVRVLHPAGLSYPIEDHTQPSAKSAQDLRNTFSWSSMLQRPEFVAAPVTAFRHAPMSDCWDNIIVGMKVEVENRDVEAPKSNPSVGTSSSSSPSANCYWVATVLRISGYMVLLRYEGFGQDGSKDFWINMCSDRLHSVGWCATKGRPLVPPKSIIDKYGDWKDFLVKRLTGARTLPSNFYLKVWETVSSEFQAGMKLEVVDKMRICQVRVATIVEITGRRLRLRYDDVDHDDREFWCHQESPLIHPVGWARRVGHQIVASQEYFDRCAMDKLRPTDCTPDMFPTYPINTSSAGSYFSVGMKMEAVDPLNLATICVATVMKVLRFGYIMIRIDGYETDATGSDWFCYHSSSPLIFPPGFAKRCNIDLKPPTGYEDKFSWYEYLKATRSQAAPIELFCNRDDVKNHYKAGMKIEATDQMDPRLVCVSTISAVVGRLVKVHFDGWDDEYDQWMDCENVDIYPVGWCELVGHKLEGPRMTPPVKKEKRKPQGRKGRKRTHAGNSGSSSASNGHHLPSATTPDLPRASTPGSTTAALVSPAAMPGTVATPSSVSSDQDNSSASISPVVANGGGGGLGGKKARKSDPEFPSASMALEEAHKFSGGTTTTPGNVPSSLPTGGGGTNGGRTSSSTLQPLHVGAPTVSNLIDDNNRSGGLESDMKGPAVTAHAENEAADGALEQSLMGAASPLNPVGTPSGSDMEATGAVVSPVKIIPRLVDSAGQAAVLRGKDSNLNPSSWTVEEVGQFLQINECASLSEAFIEEKVDGVKFLTLTKEDVMRVVNNKIGPCLKVENLLRLLKTRMNPAQARFQATMTRKSS